MCRSDSFSYATSAAGAIQVEVQDEQGSPIEGRSLGAHDKRYPFEPAEVELKKLSRLSIRADPPHDRNGGQRYDGALNTGFTFASAVTALTFIAVFTDIESPWRF
jgi:hypothetical protein